MINVSLEAALAKALEAPRPSSCIAHVGFKTKIFRHITNLSIQMYPTPSDDEDGDIADDPLLSAVSADLERATKQNDQMLLLALGAIVTLLFLAEHFLGKNPVLEGFAAAAVVGAIVFTMYAVLRRKAGVATKYGLICPVCTHKPSATMVLSAARTRKCRKCGASLNG
jgi:hypothetical protein